MNFNNSFLKSLRILLFPVSLVYWLIVTIRNYLFNKGVFTGTSFNFPIICIGNLAAGGTGKTPMVLYMANLLKDKYKVAVLSRGYKRKTTGYVLAEKSSSALDIGDEPMLFHNKLHGVAVAVGEKRVEAIPLLLHDRPDTDIILLDDAFQHRKIIAGMNILLTEYENLYTRDWYLPTGDLRDSTLESKRANIIVVTKCPDDLSANEMENIKQELKLLKHQHLFFTGISYGSVKHIITGETKNIADMEEVLLVTGIANPKPLKKYLAQQVHSFEELSYSDHHIFSIDDLNEIKNKFKKMEPGEKIILTTEKDAVRLVKFGKEIASLPFYTIPVEMKFIDGNEQNFVNIIEGFIASYQQNKINNA